MDALPDRLAAALAPDYEILAEIDRGGMGIVYLARDVTLECDVAIKVLRPELATARAADRFLREARVLASLRHPGIIVVHRAGEADGLPFYVMDYLPGRTLADRLASGPLGVPAALATGRAILEALDEAHRAGVVHRDIKPSNVLLMEDRVVLGDFGLAKSGTDTSTESGRGTAGTPGYMPPEQATSGTATPRTDLYAVAMVIYEAITGRRWVPCEDPENADWGGVPRRVGRVLMRALAWSPERRWPDAPAFVHALASAGRTRGRWRVAALGGVALTALLMVGPDTCWTADPSANLALLPLGAVGVPATLGLDITLLTRTYLETIPQLRLAPERTVLGLRYFGNAPGGAMERARALSVRFVADGTVTRSGDGIDVLITLTDSVGPSETSFRLTGTEADLAGIADALALGVIRTLYPQLRGTYRGPVHLSDSFDAVREFLRGEEAFYGGAWIAAQRYYGSALTHDSAFALARWRLVNAWRWTPGRTPDLQPHLERLLTSASEQLRPIDVQLIGAQLERGAADRLTRYETAVRSFPGDEYAVLLYGEELFHRGPLAGLPFDSALTPLVRASELDAFLTPAFELLAWFHIRRRERDPAAHALERLRIITQPLPPEELSHVVMLSYAWTEQFEPGEAGARRQALFAAPEREAADRLDFALRAGLAFSLPQVQLELGQLAIAQRRRSDLRWKGHYAQAFALTALGRPAAALRQIDSAAFVLRTDTARLFAAQWRIIPHVIGLPLVSEEERQRGRDELERLLTLPATGAAAGWTLALDAIALGDTGRLRRIETDLAALGWSMRAEQRGVLDALRAREQTGDPGVAIERATPLLLTDIRRPTDDAFVRLVLHMALANWFDEVGDARAADAARRFHENLDIVGWLTGPPQAAEVEWALGPYIDLRRAGRVEDAAAACALARQAVTDWRAPEPHVAALRDSAGARIGPPGTGPRTPACPPGRP